MYGGCNTPGKACYREGRTAMEPGIRALVDINIEDILAAVGPPERRLARALVRPLARGPAVRFAREMAAFDEDVRRRGIADASRFLLHTFALSVRTAGLPGIPARGPVLLLSNHPGMTDTLVLLASIPRADLQVLAADRPFLRALPAASRHLIFLPDEKERRLAAVRRAVDHLRAGGALLTFPAGEIEPDPAVLPGAVQALERWSDSSLRFLRFVPGCVVVPLVVSGVLQPRAEGSLLVRLVHRRREDRERSAAMLQVLVHTLAPGRWRTRVSLEALEGFPGRELLAHGKRAREMITARIAARLSSRPTGGPRDPLSARPAARPRAPA